MYGSRLYRQSRGGLLSSIGRVAGRLLPTVARAIPGVGTVMGIAGGVASAVGAVRGARAVAPTLTGFTPPGMAPVPGLRGVAQRLIPGGESGFRRKGRRMNAGNAKAARRAIRRIKGVRDLLKSIERELPRRPAARGSAGVITRREAERALRS